MAELILSAAGRALGARAAPAALRNIASALGQAAGSAIGRGIDQRVFGPSRRSEGPRLADIHLQASSEGASLPVVYGCTRLAGQVIWAARFKERTQTSDVGGGGKGGGGAEVTTYAYSLSFAVGLCEGEIARVSRAWANGEPFDLSETTWRLHRGSEDQAVDPLIEAIEGASAAPAYRGLAYIVFEDLPLDRFGNVMPQLSFEVVRATPSSSPRLEDMARGVCLIPGSGEFIYATDIVRRSLGPGRETSENAHAETARANIEVALDQLAADLPNVRSVMLVVSWFGVDLRCAQCAIKPGVEIAAKDTAPFAWRVNGVSRAGAHLVSQIDGAPAYGGTPSDRSVIQAIQALKARGYRVGLYPFILMDVAPGNALPDPYGATAQAAYPWRGRITPHPAAGQPGAPDKTAAAGAQIAAFVGAAAPSHFGANGDGVTYSGPEEFSFRRFILHHAKLAQIAGGVDAFILGSELRGLTTARDSAVHFPFVQALKTLAGEVRAMLGAETKLTYAADWSEYRGHQPADGTGDVFFHLDPLWADAAIDCIGVDWYPPLTDWRDGDAHADRALASSIHDEAYLEGRIEAGENYDWYYADGAARAAQARSPITDGAYGKPWVFRAKDVRSFWNNAHYDRPGGVEAATPTAWVAQSKPIWLVELGCAALDKGANAPNLFFDPKSSESALPPFSSGARDDLIQRRVLEAYLRYWDPAGAANPISSLTGARMIDMENAHLWCWDARPYPAFPARDDIWADGESWRRGHWLSGRVATGDLAAVVADICARAGVETVDVAALRGVVAGYIVDQPTRARDALEPLMQAYDFTATESGGVLRFAHRGAAAPSALALEDCVEGARDAFALRGDPAETAIEARVRFLSPQDDHRAGAVSARRRDAARGGVIEIAAPLSLDEDQARALADRALADARIAIETLTVAAPPTALALEPGDAVQLDAAAGVFEITRIEDAEARVLSLRRARAPAGLIRYGGETRSGGLDGPAPTPDVAVLDLPLMPGAGDDQRPFAAVYANPWRGPHRVYVDAAMRGEARAPAAIGRLAWPLYPGPVGRWDEGNLFQALFPDAVLSSATRAAVLNGANAFAVEGADGLWEVIQAREIALVGPQTYLFSGLLRGALGSEAAMAAPAPAGARIVRLDSALARLEVRAHEWGEALRLAVPPAGRPASDPPAAIVETALPRVAAKALAPAHLRAARLPGGDIAVRWVRRARLDGDGWGPGEPPLGADAEGYLVQILNAGAVVRTFTPANPTVIYGAAEQIADFGAPPSLLALRVGQIGGDGAIGFMAESVLAV